MHVGLLTASLDPACGWGRYSVDFCTALAAVPGITFTVYAPASEDRHRDVPFGGCVAPILAEWQPTFVGARPPDAASVGSRDGRPPDLLHCLVEFPYAVVAHAWAGELRVPFIVSLHGTYAVRPFQSPREGRAYGEALSAAAAVTAPSRYTAQALQRASRREIPVAVLSNAVDEGRFADRAAGDVRVIDGRFVLTVGALKPRKGIDVLVRAFARVAPDYPDVRLVIVGEGDQRPALEALIAACHLTSRVLLAGGVSESAVIALFRACTLFALVPVRIGGDFEGFGLVYLEAGCCAKPVVASDSGGVRDAVVHERNGLLVPADDEEAAARAMARLLDDPALAARLGAEGLAMARTRTWPRYVATMTALYRRALGEKARA